MNTAIDIVITYVTDNDDLWLADYNKYKQEEINSGIQPKSNRQAFGKERTRDWEFLPYWFRAVEKNCSWARYIWFVCQRESQVPTWLNKNNPKLKIIYHDQFIPQEFLPTFNPMVIKSFLFNIKDLADNFIESSDDMFFIGKIPENMFFIDNHPVDDPVIHDYYRQESNNTAFDKIIINKNEFLHRIYNMDYKYHFHHLPLARNKVFELQFYNKYKAEIDTSLLVSRFRHPQNLIWHMYTDAMKFEKFSIEKNIFKNCSCFHLAGKTFDTSQLNDKDIIVINDTEFITDFNYLKYVILDWFYKHFPNKSQFEILDTCKNSLEQSKLLIDKQKTLEQESNKQVHKPKEKNYYLYF